MKTTPSTIAHPVRRRPFDSGWSAAIASAVLLSAALPGRGQGSLTPPGAPAPSMKSLAEIEPRTAIAALPITLSNSGSYYLTGPLTGVSGFNGITISANDVTLDLNGFALTGVPGSISAINCPVQVTNLVVLHGMLRNWGNGGVNGFNTIRGGRFEGLCVSSNYNGLALGFNCVVKDCVATYNGNYGIEASSGSVISHCVASYNGAVGIYGQFLLVENCTSSYNGSSGIYAFNDSRVLHCHALQNGTDGIVLGSGGHALENTCLGNNTVGSTNWAGIRTFYQIGHIEGNLVGFSSGMGIYLSTNAASLSTGWVVTRNHTSGPSAAAYVYPSGNDIGPIGTAATATSPWANLRD